jgi:hypothetical protein
VQGADEEHEGELQEFPIVGAHGGASPEAQTAGWFAADRLLRISCGPCHQRPCGPTIVLLLTTFPGQLWPGRYRSGKGQASELDTDPRFSRRLAPPPRRRASV